jgi:hypothetical protein
MIGVHRKELRGALKKEIGGLTGYASLLGLVKEVNGNLEALFERIFLVFKHSTVLMYRFSSSISSWIPKHTLLL